MKWKDDPPSHLWPQLLAITEATAATSPENAAIWIGLAQSALTLGGEDDAIAPLLAAVSRTPDSSPLRSLVARLLFDLDRLEEAREHLDAALRIDPENRNARVLDFVLLVKMGQWSDAAARFDDVLAIDRFQPQLLETLWRTGDLPDVLARSEAMLAEQPWHANATYFRAYALAAMGREEEARQAMPTHDIVAIADLPVPAGYADRDAFNAALRQEIRDNPTLVWNQRTKSTRDGARTRRLRQPGAHAVEALVGQIRSAISAYVERQTAMSDAFARARPDLARLDIWANILGGDGFLMSHRHISGWLSGVYYVTAPAEPDGSYSGPLLFGALDPKRDKIDPPWDVRRIEPVPGRLVLFPSYAPHATEPTGAAGERISVGFDVIPV